MGAKTRHRLPSSTTAGDYRLLFTKTRHRQSLLVFSGFFYRWRLHVSSNCVAPFQIPGDDRSLL